MWAFIDNFFSCLNNIIMKMGEPEKIKSREILRQKNTQTQPQSHNQTQTQTQPQKHTQTQTPTNIQTQPQSHNQIQWNIIEIA